MSRTGKTIEVQRTVGICVAKEKRKLTGTMGFFFGGGGSEGVIKCSKFILLIVSHCHKDTKITELCNYSSKQMSRKISGLGCGDG